MVKLLFLLLFRASNKPQNAGNNNNILIILNYNWFPTMKSTFKHAQYNYKFEIPSPSHNFFSCIFMLHRIDYRQSTAMKVILLLNSESKNIFRYFMLFVLLNSKLENDGAFILKSVLTENQFCNLFCIFIVMCIDKNELKMNHDIKFLSNNHKNKS